MFDVIVVGAGIEGSSTAYNLVKRNKTVLLLEQFPLPHSRGSSHGQTRVTRKAYPEPFYAAMMDYCTHAWRGLQQDAGETLYKQVGYLAIGLLKGQILLDKVAAMTKYGSPYTLLTPGDLRKKYPMLTFDDVTGGLLDPEGGILMADKCLRALHGLYIKKGGLLKDNEQFTGLTPGETVTVKTNKGSYQAKSVVFACGPWTNKALSSLNVKLPIAPTRISVVYWPERFPGSHSTEKLPTFYYWDSCRGHEIYGLPSDEYPGHVKLCLHHGPAIDPDRRDDVRPQWVLDLLADYVQSHFPGLEPRPSVVESCIYTNTPDKHFILDQHPVMKNVIIGAGFSGHGFKLAPAVGQILADLALGLPASFDISHFRLDRFSQAPSSKL